MKIADFLKIIKTIPKNGNVQVSSDEESTYTALKDWKKSDTNTKEKCKSNEYKRSIEIIEGITMEQLEKCEEEYQKRKVIRAI